MSGPIQEVGLYSTHVKKNQVLLEIRRGASEEERCRYLIEVVEGHIFLHAVIYNSVTDPVETILMESCEHLWEPVPK